MDILNRLSSEGVKSEVLENSIYTSIRVPENAWAIAVKLSMSFLQVLISNHCVGLAFSNNELNAAGVILCQPDKIRPRPKHCSWRKYAQWCTNSSSRGVIASGWCLAVEASRRLEYRLPGDRSGQTNLIACMPNRGLLAAVSD